MATETQKQLNAKIAEVEKKITKLYGSTFSYAAQLAQVKAAIANGDEFEWAKNPEAAKQIDQRLTAVATALDGYLSKATETSYKYGQASVNAMVQIFGKANKKEVESVMKDATAEMRKRGADAHAFYTQPYGGATISERVWKLNESTKLELEVAIQNAALEGKSAAELAQSVQQYLNHPDRLYRHVKVIDPETGKWNGEYRMSKAAQKMHPGRGVYRSAYKNALRLARTELTQAYRRAEWETYQDNPLITGYRIELSNNHTTTVVTKKGRRIEPLHDICDEMAGTQYPKTFLWTGWHPQCRCRMVPITISTDDFKERVKARHRGKLDEWKPKEQTTEMPAAFTKWVDENKHRWQQPGHAAPFFIRDNYQQGNVAKGLDTRITAELEQARLAAEATKTKAKEPPTPQPITDYDTEVMELRSVASKYDLDLTRIEQLRASGEDKKALRQSISMQQKLWRKREENWKNAYRDAEVQIQGLRILLATYSSQESTRDFWELRDTIIPNWQSIIDDYDPAYGVSASEATKWLKHAKKDIEKLYYKYEAIFKKGANTQPNVPAELKEGSGYMKKGETLDNEFFKLIDPKKPIKLYIEDNDENSYSTGRGDAVYIRGKKRGEMSPWEKRSVIYHEYGHCIDAQRVLWRDKNLIDMRDKQIKDLKKTGKYPKWVREYNYETGRLQRTKKQETMSLVEYIDEKLYDLKRRVMKMKSETFTKRGITRDDVIEQIVSTRDTIKSLVISYGEGHPDSYFSQTRKKETEYLAHAFENAFIGNRIFEKYLPEIYNEMIAYIKALKTF